MSALRERGPLALFLDFDGTLVELARGPDDIVVPEGLVEALTRLSDRLDGRLALVSGRAIVDLEKHLGPLALARAGSHGADCRLADGTVLGAAPAGLASGALEEIAAFAESEGFVREDKPHGGALHYRHDPALEDKGLAFAEAFAARHGLAVKRGKCVIEFVANAGADKGGAVAALMAEAPFAGALPVFVGDDVTDEDGFRAAGQLGGFGVLVGDREGSQARYGLGRPTDVYEWLEIE
ncbi:trehalose-phosphatase [Aurantiacibacter suaedae]|uniref:trehalose-phosphatase n=1 Tax=Aurantiacibacter suaedae TaxID=2545755 RepID=UPI001F501DEF|nr:trehalose-phosphatase [Aurantiacibacter suaedae]